MNNKFNFLLSRYKAYDDKELGAMLTVKSSKPLIRHIIIMTELVVGSINQNWVKHIIRLLRRIKRIHSTQGSPGLVKYLKSCTIVLQQSISGHHTHDITPLGPRISRSKSGLPRFFPVEIRNLIRESRYPVIKWSLTILSFFRVILYESNPKTSTITDPPRVSVDMIQQFNHLVPRALAALIGKDLKPLSVPSFTHILSSSPNSRRQEGEHSTHPNSMIRSLTALPKFVSAWDSLLWFVGKYPSVINKLIYYGFIPPTSLRGLEQSRIGKIGLTLEPAGKVRIFAMADPWTQLVLRPLHKWIFSYLRGIPMDGTFNQLGPLDRVTFSGPPIYSLDLTAATDRLPIVFQERILQVLFGAEYAKNWVSLLVNRPYHISYIDIHSKERINERLFYRTGQPMGSLSSWAMLALSHHVIVQIASIIAGVKVPFTGYALLGDDIVIWSKAVQKEYLNIMGSFGVDINLTKSIVSRTGIGLEFAKRTILNGIDVSPLTLKEYFSAIQSSSALVTFQARHSVSLPLLKKMVGLGYKSSPKSRRAKMLHLVLTAPTNLDMFTNIFLKILLNSSHSEDIKVSTMYSLISSWIDMISDLIRRVEKDHTLVQSHLGRDWKSPSKYRVNHLLKNEYYYFMLEEMETLYLEKIQRARDELWDMIPRLKLLRASAILFRRLTKTLLFLPTDKNKTIITSELKVLLEQYFQLEEDYSRLQVPMLLNPSPQSSEASPKREASRLRRLWNRWFRALNNSDFVPL